MLNFEIIRQGWRNGGGGGHISLHRISCDPLSTSKINIHTSSLRIGAPHEHSAFTQRALDLGPRWPLDRIVTVMRGRKQTRSFCVREVGS